MRWQRLRCAECRERFDYLRDGPGRTPRYCVACRFDIERAKAALRMQNMRRRRQWGELAVKQAV